MQLSSRIQAVLPSPTLAIQARAKALKAQGEKVFSLAAGEPDFPTPAHIRQAAVSALEAGHTGYTPSAGIPELRQAVRRWAQERVGVSYEDNQVVVCCGAKQCLFNAFISSLEPGCEAIIQTPYWVSYPEQVRLCGAEPILLPAPPSGFGLNLDALCQAINKRTRVIVINSPCNPTGQVLSESDLRAVADLALKHDLWIISDDIYDRLLYDGRRFTSIVSLEPKVVDRTVVVNGLSKSYSMTGWRLGYALGPAEMIGAMRKVQDQSTSNATTFVQHAAVTALGSPPSVVDDMVHAFDQRRRRLVQLLSAIPGVNCPMPAGTFYAFPNFANILGKRFKDEPVTSSLRLAELLLEHERVAVIPGEAFGAPGYLRFSFAASMEVIEEGSNRVKRIVASLKG